MTLSSIQYPADRRLIDTNIPGDFGLVHSSSHAIHDLVVESMGRLKFLSLLKFIPSFREAVLHIVNPSPEKKMGRITALWVVAVVEHPKTVWNWTVGIFKRNTMSACPLHSLSNLSVSLVANASSPRPALVWATNMHSLPEPFLRFLNATPIRLLYRLSSFCMVCIHVGYYAIERI